MDFSKYIVRPRKADKHEVLTPGFLEREFGQDVVKEYNSIVASDYHNNENLAGKLSFDNGVVKGSSHFIAPIVNKIIRPAGLHVADLSDIERINEAKSLDLLEVYVDIALVLRSVAEPNKYLAKNLYDQVKARKGKFERPIMIPLSGVETVLDEESPFGLAFKLLDDAKIDHTDRFGKDSGLSGSSLHWDWYLRSPYGHLASSDSRGRVVVESGEAATQKTE